MTTNCLRCGKEQTAFTYCVQWKENDCIRMGAVVVNIDEDKPKKELDFNLLKKTKLYVPAGTNGRRLE